MAIESGKQTLRTQRVEIMAMGRASDRKARVKRLAYSLATCKPHSYDLTLLSISALLAIHANSGWKASASKATTALTFTERNPLYDFIFSPFNCKSWWIFDDHSCPIPLSGICIRSLSPNVEHVENYWL